MSIRSDTPVAAEPTQSSPVDATRLRLHVAEYTTLTTRSTYWMLIQSGLWPRLVLFLTTVVEQYKNILYIERHLRPLIERTTGKRDFWQYERWLEGERGGSQSWFEFGPVALPITYRNPLPLNPPPLFPCAAK